MDLDIFQDMESPELSKWRFTLTGTHGSKDKGDPTV